jgi:hypothetical protein
LASIASSGQLNIDPLRIVPDQVKAKCIPINGLRPAQASQAPIADAVEHSGRQKAP